MASSDSKASAKSAAAGTKKAPVKKAPAKTASAKTTPAKTAPAKKASVKTTSAAEKAPAKKVPAKKSRAKNTALALVVRADEKPWTAKELTQVRNDLEADRVRLQGEVASVQQGLEDLLRDAGVGAGNDQADLGSSTLERDAEMSLANNTREMLFQVQRALARLDDGTYGVCESCENPIGKQRLMAFPRATLCLTCKQREERR